MARGFEVLALGRRARGPQILISPSEPIRLKSLGSSSSIPERYGCDYLIIAKGQRTGVQRKEFPGDFISSMADGRLYELVREMAPLDRAILILEGQGRWLDNGQLDFAHAKINRTAFHGIIFTLAWEWGIEVWQNGGMDETKQMLADLEHWAGKSEHKSLNTRPGPKKAVDAWGVKDNEAAKRHRAIHVLQSFEGIGPGLAEAIYQHFGRLPLGWDVTVSQLLEVPGIGKKKAAGIAKVLPFIREAI